MLYGGDLRFELPVQLRNVRVVSMDCTASKGNSSIETSLSTLSFADTSAASYIEIMREVWVDSSYKSTLVRANLRSPCMKRASDFTSFRAARQRTKLECFHGPLFP